MQRVKWQLEEFDSLKKRADYSTVYESATDLSKQSEGILHSVNVYRMRLLECAFEAGCHLEKWAQAVEFAKDALPGYRLHFRHGHPAVTCLLAEVGKTLQFVGQLEEAEIYLQQAFDEAKISHGVQHPLFEKISELLSSCREERRVRLENS